MKTSELHDKIFNTVTSNGMREMTLFRFREAIGMLWTSPCICPPDEKTGETLCCNHCGKPTARTTSKELPRDEEMKDWAEIHAIHCYHDGLTSKKHFVEGYLYAVDFFKNNYASPLLASKDARIRELEEANKLAEIKIAELIELNLTPPKN